MTFWEDVMEKAKEGAQKVQKVTLDTVDKVKLKSKLSKLKSDVNKLYAELGRFVYNETCGDFVENYNEKTKRIINEITRLKKEIADVKKELGK